MSDETREGASTLEADGFFALRTPLLPWDELDRWASEIESARLEGDDLETGLARDRERLRAKLARWVDDPIVREALLVATPDLHASLEEWRARPEGSRGRRTERALVRYFIRMCTRPTPFGLFAGTSLGRVGERTRLTLGARDEGRRHARLDMDYLFALGQALTRRDGVREHLVLRVNSSLDRARGRLHYVESRLEGRVRSHHLVAIDPTPHLEATLARAAEGATRTRLAAALVTEDVSREEAEAFIDELVERQILVSDLEPLVTGEEALRDQARTLSRSAAGHEEVGALRGVQDDLEALSQAPPGEAVDRYDTILARLRTLPVRADLPYLFQVDLVKHAPNATLGVEVANEIARGIGLLRRLTPRTRRTSLDRFRSAFLERYEGRPAPLLEALDEERGIGFDPSAAADAESTPLLAGLRLSRAADEGERSGERRRARWLWAHLSRGASDPLELDDSAIDALAADDPAPLPDALAAMVTVTAASSEALDAGDFRVILDSLDGPSGARLLGRFCHGDPALRKAVISHLRAEERHRPDAIFAEVVHLPEGRVGNVLGRPLLREYEIPFLGRSGAPPEARIPLEDLWVSIEEERVVLRSARLGREVLPRLTTAHNFAIRSLGIYRFLCSLQEQGVAAHLGWSWESFEDAPFLPRVVQGRLILRRARWRVDAAELASLVSASDRERFERLRAWRRARGLSRWAVLVDFDHRWPVDFENVLAVESFVHLVARRPEFVLEEMLPGPDALIAQGPEGRFTHELVVPFARRSPRESAGIPRHVPRSLARSPAPRRFAPGSEWLYAKLFTGPATADHVLRQVVAPLLQRLNGGFSQWFFVRYADPAWHLRLRLRGEPSFLLREALPALEALAKPFLEDGRVRRLALDTYEPEIERYGGAECLAISERMFEADSACALAILVALEGDGGLDLRWQLALRGTDLLLEDLGLDLQARVRLLEGVRDSLRRELGTDRAFELALDERFRSRRRDLERLYDGAGEPDEARAAALAELRTRSQRLRPWIESLRAAAAASGSEPTRLAASHVHMHCNRMLRSAHRPQEMVIAHFLIRLHRSSQARLGAPEGSRPRIA